MSLILFIAVQFVMENIPKSLLLGNSLIPFAYKITRSERPSKPFHKLLLDNMIKLHYTMVHCKYQHKLNMFYESAIESATVQCAKFVYTVTMNNYPGYE